MRFEYQLNDLNNRGYLGISLNEQECRNHLKGSVKDNLLDIQERDTILTDLRALRQDTGFEANDGLLADIQALEDESVDVQNFRVGEAYAEVFLEQEFSCRFYWNELRDARNPKGNKTGADLIGFIGVNEKVLYLFGEVKISSEIAKRPPQAMTGATGIVRQLSDLYKDRNKRQILISYLQNKMRLFPANHPFKQDFIKGQSAYYSNTEDYHLFGVLVRDVEPDERDLFPSYSKLKTQILEPVGLKLLALYLPIQQSDWLNIINEESE